MLRRNSVSKGLKGMDWIFVGQGTLQWWGLWHGNEFESSKNGGEFLDQMSDSQLLKRAFALSCYFLCLKEQSVELNISKIQLHHVP
jgi:hypothetical protein